MIIAVIKPTFDGDGIEITRLKSCRIKVPKLLSGVDRGRDEVQWFRQLIQDLWVGISRNGFAEANYHTAAVDGREGSPCYRDIATEDYSIVREREKEDVDIEGMVGREVGFRSRKSEEYG